MKRKILAASVALIGAALASQAGAAPLAKSQSGILADGKLVTVDWRRDRDRRDHDRRSWRRGDYEKHGWHRFDRRPGDWRRRGCVVVGPVWFCP